MGVQSCVHNANMITFHVCSMLFYYIGIKKADMSGKKRTSGHPTFSKIIVSEESAATAARRVNTKERVTFANRHSVYIQTSSLWGSSLFLIDLKHLPLTTTCPWSIFDTITACNKKTLRDISQRNTQLYKTMSVTFHIYLVQLHQITGCYVNLMPSHLNIHTTYSVRCVIPYITNSQHLRFTVNVNKVITGDTAMAKAYLGNCG